MELPDSFITTIKNVYKEEGEQFLSALPSFIDEISQHWGLTDVLQRFWREVPENSNFNKLAEH